MKQAANFRLDSETVNLLTLLHEQLHLSKTEILERAVKRYAKAKLNKTSSLMKFAGSMSADNADELLEIIQQRNNKNFDQL